MNTDFECELSALLHETTPQPPRELTAPTVATLTASHEHDDVEVLELGRVDEVGARRRRWLPAIAAAAVIVAVAGAVVANRATRDDGTPVGSGPANVEPCRSGQLLLSADSLTSGGTTTGVLHIKIDNSQASACKTALPSLAISNKSEMVGAFPNPNRGNTPVVTIPGGGHVTLTVFVRIGDTCLAGSPPSRLELARFRASFSLGSACSPTPDRWAFTVSS